MLVRRDTRRISAASAVTGSLIARLMAVLLVATGAPALAAVGLSTASADTGPGSTQQNPIQLTSPNDVPAGSTSTGSTSVACATTSTWTHTVPAVASTNHAEYRYSRAIPAVAEVREYRWPVETRSWVPAVSEVKEYTYKKPVATYKTQHWAKYQKYVQGKVQKNVNNSWTNYSTFDWEKWAGSLWNTTGTFQTRDWSDTASPDVIAEGAHNSTSATYSSIYRKVSQRYSYRVIERQTRQVQTGTTYEYKDWTTEVLGAPWVKTGERVKVAAVPAHWGSWTPAGYTAWGTSSTKPADTDTTRYGTVESRVKTAAIPGYTEYYVAGGTPSRDIAAASWILETTLAGWTRFEERSVSNNDAKPAAVTYYAYNDQQVCETTTPTPPAVTPVPAPVLVVEVLGEEDGRATGRLYTSCQRTVRATMKNASSSTVAYKVVVGKKVTTVRVKAGSTRRWTTTGDYRSMAKLMLDGKVLAKKRVPAPCSPPEVLPATGMRH